MKIFYPLEVFYPSQAGGPANTIYWITKNLIPHGFEPVIVATDKGIESKVPLDTWLNSDGGRAIYIRTRFLNFPLRQTLTALRTFAGCDVVHVSSFFYPAAFVTGIAARLMRKKLVWSARGELDTKALKHSRGRKLPVLAAIRLIVGRYPLFHSTCDEETRYIKLAFGDSARVVQIANYLEIPKPFAREPREYFLYIGRIHPKKAIDNLIRAVSASDRFMASRFVLKIAGAGKEEFEEPLRKLVSELGLQDKVEFLGQVEGEAKQKLYADAYFTIMPSHTENFGVVVLESLAQGTPVIASKGSPWESLEKERVGYWIENSKEAIAESIDRALSIPSKEYLEMRRRSRPYVEREFDIDQNIGQWIDVYNSL
ncbi:MAG: glycosyltransferase [Acidobacteria bacterium]|nr:glycosyltransferase [Acidobacteriota bacterium]